MNWVLRGIILTLVTSCIKQTPQLLSPQPQPLTGNASSVWISSEGNFGYSNADISVYNPATGQVTNEWFKAVNGKGPGDVIQSIYEYNGRMVVIVNNSGKVIEIDQQGRQIAEKNGFVSPRYMHYVNAQTAYLSDFKSQYISIIDPVSFEKKAQISCPGWTEGFIPLYSEVWACNPFKDYVYCISEQHKITDSIKVAKSIFSGVKDAKDRVWLMSAPYNDSGVLYALDVQSRQIVQKLDLKGKALSQLVLNERKDTLFFIQQDLWYLSLNQPNALPAPYITLNAMNPYGFGKDPRSGRFYISDVKDYTSRSEIFVYNAKGQPLTSFNAGVNASGFYFK